ncbi:hypothetical protein BJX65DRAFT_308707 [Aspergillus insuetus]
MGHFCSLRRSEAEVRRTPLDDEHRAVHDASRKALKDMFVELKTSAAHKLDDDEVRHLGAIPQSLDSRPTATSYFNPFPIERMKRTPVDMNDDNIRFMLQARERNGERLARKKLMAVNEFTALCATSSRPSYADLDENVLADKYEAFADLGQSMPAPCTTDIRCQLLRTEILTLIGIIITRLKARSLTDHRVMPVMAVYCFQGARARILQAFMTDVGLVTYNTKLYDFLDYENRDDAIEQCLSYMASTPIGDTKSLKYNLPPEDS